MPGSVLAIGIMNGRLGATPLGEGRCAFLVWAPRAKAVELVLEGEPARSFALEPDAEAGGGCFSATLEGIEPGTPYRYRLDGGEARADPASRFQPRGLLGPSEVVDSRAFEWHDQDWGGVPLERCVLYEAHVGTFTREGTFRSAIERLDGLRELGVTMLELMPVAQFPGARNWGYDGVLPFAVQDSYGGPSGLAELADACHARGLGLALDVVYNHIGPEGAHLAEFGPYFAEHHCTPWGPAFNFDGPESDEVRCYFVQNARSWVSDYHVDALRIDAIHAIFDASARPFLAELADAVHGEAERLGRVVHVIAESDLNDPRVLRASELGGYGHDAQWNDDFHHALHALLTGERRGYYADFGRVGDLARALSDAFVYTGQRSGFRHRRHGAPPSGLGGERFVVCAQNHDQVGNRARGERLAFMVSFEATKLAAGAVLTAPNVPLLFMGEEYGERAPFLYFVDHASPELVEAVRRGRREQFAAFHEAADVPDPADESTFLRSKIDPSLPAGSEPRALRELYRELLRLRREVPALARLARDEVETAADEERRMLLLLRGTSGGRALAVFNFSDASVPVEIPSPLWPLRRLLDSADVRWAGPGALSPESIEAGAAASIVLAPESFALYIEAVPPADLGGATEATPEVAHAVPPDVPLGVPPDVLGRS